MEYNSAKVLTAWKAFVGKGLLMEGNLRPEIVRSWLRCKKQGLDPWSVDFPKPSKELLQQKQVENHIILEKAHPVLEYLLAVFNCNISISDSLGFIFDFVTPLDFYPRTFGTFIEEEITGNGSITIVIQEKKPFRLEGYEHYRAVSQGYSGVSAPIILLDKIIGVLTITNPFASLPEYALDSCIEGAKIISELVQAGYDDRRLLSTAQIFGRIIEKSDQAVIVLDDMGRIILANEIGKKIVVQYEEMAYGAQSFKEYLLDKEDLTLLLDCENDLNIPHLFRFKQIKNQKEPGLPLISRRRIHFHNGMIQIVLVFESPTKVEDNKTKPSMRNPQNMVDYIGKSDVWKRVDKVVHKVATYNTNVLLLGETGTGKEVVARAIHRLSGRTGKFVAVNCGAIPKDLLASELFGYESGAFTGAKAGGSIGKFEYANGGTLFLDEIGEMPLEVQVSLLRVLQEKTITRIGSCKSQKFDVRIVAATNQDMRKVIQEGAFRSDLYYRLSVIEIKLPLLKERQCDIALLAEFFNGSLSEELQIPHYLLSDEIINVLVHYEWPGNVRELKNIMEKLLILSDGNPATVDLLPDYIKEQIENREAILCCPKEDPCSEKERICISLESYGGNISQVAKELGMARNTLYRKMEKYHIEIKTFALNKYE
jgi:transcriptional regulator with PAS, ATPase and Fis domain